jgi:hypothetical protein
VRGLLMVSRLRYNSFKGSGTGPKSERVPFFTLLIAVVVLIGLWIEPPGDPAGRPCCMRVRAADVVPPASTGCGCVSWDPFQRAVLAELGP